MRPTTTSLGRRTGRMQSTRTTWASSSSRRTSRRPRSPTPPRPRSPPRSSSRRSTSSFHHGRPPSPPRPPAGLTLNWDHVDQAKEGSDRDRRRGDVRAHCPTPPRIRPRTRSPKRHNLSPVSSNTKSSSAETSSSQSSSSNSETGPTSASASSSALAESDVRHSNRSQRGPRGQDGFRDGGGGGWTRSSFRDRGEVRALTPSYSSKRPWQQQQHREESRRRRSRCRSVSARREDRSRSRFALKNEELRRKRETRGSPPPSDCEDESDDGGHRRGRDEERWRRRSDGDGPRGRGHFHDRGCDGGGTGATSKIDVLINGVSDPSRRCGGPFAKRHTSDIDGDSVVMNASSFDDDSEEDGGKRRKAKPSPYRTVTMRRRNSPSIVKQVLIQQGVPLAAFDYEDGFSKMSLTFCGRLMKVTGLPLEEAKRVAGGMVRSWQHCRENYESLKKRYLQAKRECEEAHGSHSDMLALLKLREDLHRLLRTHEKPRKAFRFSELVDLTVYFFNHVDGVNFRAPPPASTTASGNGDDKKKEC